MPLERGNGSYLRVGHKGAAALAAGNTIPSLAAALEHGVDMVEFDVVDALDGRLVLAHSREEIEPGATTLEEALAFLSAEAPVDVGINLDLKWHGFEQEVALSLRHYGVAERAMASSFFPASLRTLRTLEPAVRTGISYPWDRRGLATRRLLAPLVLAGVTALRAVLPYRVAGMVAGAGAESVMLHYSVLSPRVVDRCHGLGISVFAWTVDEPALLEQVLATGVDGVISNDPRIFAPGATR